MAGEDIEFTTFDGDTITKNDYRQEIIDMYTESQYTGLTKVTDFTTGSEALHLADVIATFLLEHREMIDGNYRMSMIHTMEGEFLDNHGDMVGLHRYPSSPSTGIVRFTRNENVAGEISIPDGTIVSTPDAISFMVDLDTENVTIPVGVDSIEVNVICEQEGAYTNVLPFSIDRILENSVLSGKCSVTNPYLFEDGADIETDDEYRNRLIIAPFEAPTASLAWYNNVSLTPRDENDNPTIHDVYVQKNNSGNYDISIYYNPVNRSDMVEDDTGNTVLRATRDITDLFNRPEYDVAGIVLELVLASQEVVLTDTADVTYYIAVLLETGYSLELLEDKIKECVDAYNKELEIGVEVMPTILASMVQEVEGVSVCKIVAEEDGAYTECVEPISIPYNKVGFISSGIKENITELNFNLNIEVDNS